MKRFSFSAVSLVVVAHLVVAVPLDKFYKDPNVMLFSVDGPDDVSKSILLSPPLLYYGIEYNCCVVSLYQNTPLVKLQLKIVRLFYKYLSSRVVLHHQIHLDGLVELHIDMPCQSSDGRNSSAFIAPFHKDIETIPETMCFPTGVITDINILERAGTQIRCSFTESEFSPSYLIIATWKNVTLDSEQ